MTILDRLLGREPARKAVFGGPALVAYQNDVPLSVLGVDWQARARAYLEAYKVGWFYKAGSRISRDFANLDWTLAYEDAEGDNADEIVAPASNVPWESLDPLEQFLRLAEHPNPFESGRIFRQRQQIRLDFTGRALVYLENADGGGLPTGFYGISPDRMWPSRNAKGVLIGWVLDKDRPGGGVPFTADEILPIEYPSGGDDPVGVVESVYAQVAVTRAIPRHITDVMATGGRLAGMAWPKERALSEDEFQDAQRAWRNVTSDPNAARRMLLFPEPMEYAAGAATPTEIGIPELALLTREEILTAFPIAPEMLMVPMATGLNSGQTQGVVEERYWSGTMHPRAEIWEDAFQQYLLPRYEQAIGRPLDMDIDEPNLDDAPALIEKVGALKGLIAVGFDAKEAIAAVGLDGIKWNGLPMGMDPNAPPPAPAPDQPGQMGQGQMMQGPQVAMSDTGRRTTATTTEQVAKAIKARRDDVMGRELPGFAETMAAFLAEQRDRVLADIEREIGPLTKAQRTKALPEGWWDPFREDGLLREALRGLYVRLARSALQVVADEVNRTVLKANVGHVTERMLADAAARISGINETTRAAIADLLEEGVRRGYSIAQIANGVANEDFAGLRNLTAFDEARAELVARTETMLGYNKSALLGYSEFGVGRVQAIDGDGDEECAARDGQIFDVEEALSIEDHPNGTLDWAPLT